MNQETPVLVMESFVFVFWRGRAVDISRKAIVVYFFGVLNFAFHASSACTIHAKYKSGDKLVGWLLSGH